MPEINAYREAYYSMTWLGPQGYPEHANSGRCYLTGLLGILRLFGESNTLFADGVGGDGFSFRWSPVWGCPAFNGGKGPFHEIWEYIPRMLGFKACWQEDPIGGWDQAWRLLCELIDRGLPVQVGLHYSLLLPYGAKTSPRLAYMHSVMPPTGFGHHVVVAGYHLKHGEVVIYEPNDIMPYSRFVCPIDVFRQAWFEAAQRKDLSYLEWTYHKAFNEQWSLHDGYGPYLMVWIEPERDGNWDIWSAIRDSFYRNLKILRGDYPKPYACFGNQWQIPHWETGAPGMIQCVKAIRDGRLTDIRTPEGNLCRLFSEGNIPNHGVLGRRAASGYLNTVALELGKRGGKTTEVRSAAQEMDRSSGLFRRLRYTDDLALAADILQKIAEIELRALTSMETAWPIIQNIQPL